MAEEPGALSADAARLSQALHESEGRFQRLVDALQVGVVIQGTRSEVLFVNAAAARILGVPADGLVGKTSLDATPLAVREDGTPFPGEDHPAPKVLATGKPVRDVVMGFHRRAANDRVWLLVNADPQLGPDGRVEQVVCTFSDITAGRDTMERLRESERRYRQLVEKAPDIIYRTDVRGYFTYVNPAASRVMEYDDSELVGKHYLELVRGDHCARVEASLVDQFQRRVPSTYGEFMAVSKSGREVWIAQNVELLVEGDRVQGFQAVARDVTERKAAEEALEKERRQLKDIVTHAPVAMAILDAQGRCVAHSERWLKLWGLEGRPVLGQGHDEVFQSLPSKYRDAFNHALAGAVVSHAEDAVELQDGSRKYMRWTAHPWRGPEGAVAGVVIVVQNIDVLVRAREAAVEASCLKSEFVANVSHELRTPLNGVIGMASLLLGSGLREDQREYAQAIERSGRDLLETIDDILAFSKAEAGPEPEEADFDLPPLVEETIRPLAARAAARGLELATRIADDVPRAVRGDAGKIREALSQLVSNAVKFTPAGTVAVKVEAVAASPDAATVRFEVTDTGIGIAPEAHDRIFLPFHQVDSSPARAYGGTGLGLAIAKRMVEALGGEIGMRSRPAEGSAFWFTVRLTCRPETAAVRAAEAEKTRARVLVVEDNAVNRKVVVSMLEGLGHTVESAVNGREAVEACARATYDVVLMDCQMPEMDGVRATLLIREQEGASRRTPILALTASAMPSDRQRCLAAGMDDYLTKPVRLQLLDAAVRKWARGAEAGAAAPGPLAADQSLRVLEAQGGPDVALEVVDLFLQTTPQRLEEMRGALRCEDTHALAAAAHSLKGAAAQLGARGMADLCSQVMAVCRTASPYAARELLDALEAEWRSERANFQVEKDRLKASRSDPRRPR